MKLYAIIENYIKKNPTKIRVYLSFVLALLLLLNVKETIHEEHVYTFLLIAFVLLPIAIYLFVSYLYPKDKKND
jgi:Ca2+/Na+ antiporter